MTDTAVAAAPADDLAALKFRLNFFKLIARDIELLPPEMRFVDTLDRIIYNELMLGKATRQAERELKTMMVELQRAGAQAVVLGCTELEMVVDVDANVLPIYDGARLHAEAGADWILGG